MQHIEQWIGLSPALYPESKSNIYSGFSYNDKRQYIVAEFQKKYVFPSNILRAELRFSGDASFQFFCNDQFIATGPPVSAVILSATKLREKIFTLTKPYSNLIRIR